MAGRGSVDLPSLSGVQRSFGSFRVGRVAGPITVELWLDPAGVAPDPSAVGFPAKFAAYASKMDGNPDGTGDAEFLPAVPTEVPPAGFACPDGE